MLNLLTTSAQALLSFAINATGSIMLARLLGPAGRGEYAVILLIAGLVISFSSPGIGVAIVYYLGAGKENASKVVSAAILIALALGSAAAAITIALAVFVPRVIPPGVHLSLLVPILCAVPLMIVTRVLLRVLQTRRSLIALNVAMVTSGAAPVFFYVIFLLWLRLGVGGAITAFIAATIVGLGIVQWFARDSWRFTWRVGRPLVLGMLRFGTKAHIGNIFQMMNWRLDSLILAFFVGTTDVGYYVIASALSEMLWLLPDAFGTVLLPKTTSAVERDSSAQSASLARHTIFLSVLGATGLAVTGKFLLRAGYGPSFLPSYLPLLILLPGAVAFSLVRVLNSFFNGRGRPLLSSAAMGMSLVCSVILDLLLIPRYGIRGAAVAATLAYSATAVFVLWQYRRLSGASFSRALVVRVADLRRYQVAGRLAWESAGSALRHFRV